MRQRLYTIFICVLVLGMPSTVFGQEGFVQLVGIPGVSPNAMSTEEYINALFYLSIALAAFLAVVKIILAGVEYMFSEVVTDKGAARKDIIGAVIGLLIILAGVTILTTINPDLVRFNALSEAPSFDESVTRHREETRTDPCDENPTRTGCINGNLTEEEVRELERSCDGEVVRDASGSIACNRGNEEPSTNFPWEVTDSSAIEFFQNECRSGSCQIVIIGNTTNASEQEAYCDSQGGSLETRVRNQRNYYVCIR